jgi:hypothetical protein
VCGGGRSLLNIARKRVRKRVRKRARGDIKENVGSGLVFGHEHLRPSGRFGVLETGSR